MAGRVRLTIPSVVLIAAVALTGAYAGQAPAPPEATPATVALVETWADGRVVYELTGPRRASMWTPKFPRVAGYLPPEGAKPVHAVQLTRVLVGHDIKVDVSVLLGSTEQPGVPVATVLVSPGSRVVVHELTRFGVQPLTLSMADVAPMASFLPTVMSVSADIEVADVAFHDAPYPGYRVTLRNLGDRAVSNVHVVAYRGEKRALSTIKRSDDGRPLMQPGATYTFGIDVTTGGGPEVAADGTLTPRPLDVIELDSVRWADGTHHGTPPFPQMEPLVEIRSGQRLQLRRIVDALRQTVAESGSGPELLAAAANRIGAMPAAEPDQLENARDAMRSTRGAALADIERFAEEHGAQPDTRTTIAWLTAMQARYQAWLTRLSPP